MILEGRNCVVRMSKVSLLNVLKIYNCHCVLEKESVAFFFLAKVTRDNVTDVPMQRLHT